MGGVLIPVRAHFPPITLFFFPSLSPFYTSFFPLLVLSSNFFLPFPPAFLSFSFSYSFPIHFLPPHSFSSFFSSPFCCLPLFYSPDFFLLSPSSLFLIFFPSCPSFFSYSSLPRGCHKTKKIKAEQIINKFRSLYIL